jgi:hypothetical protein
MSQKGHNKDSMALLHRGAQETKLCMVACNIFESSVQNLFHVTFLAPRILRWLLDFWKTCVSLLLHICEQIPCKENFQFLAWPVYCRLSNIMCERGG